MAITFSTRNTFICGLIVVMFVAVSTKAQFRPSNRILFSDNATTKLYPFNTKVQELLPSTTKPIASVMPSQQIKRSKSRQKMASSINKRRFRNHRNNYPLKLNFSSTEEALRRDSNIEATTHGFAKSMETSSLSSGWPQLQDVMVTSKIHKPRRLHKTNSVVDSKNKLNAKSKKRLKRRRRILERKVHNRTRKLIKQKLKIKSRIKNHSKVRQNLKNKAGHQLSKHVVDFHVVSTTTMIPSPAIVSTKPKIKAKKKSSSKHKGRKLVVRSRKSKTAIPIQDDTLKLQHVPLLNSQKTTAATAKTINQDISESNDSMLACIVYYYNR